MASILQRTCEVTRKRQKWLAPWEGRRVHFFQKWLAPWPWVILSMARTSHADLPPAPWHWGQTEKSDTTTQPPRPLSLVGLAIDANTPEILPFHGASSGMPFALTCGPDELVVGLWGHASNAVDTIGLYCSRMQSNGILQAAEKRPAVGTAMTDPFLSQCPQHEAIIGLRGRAAIKLDRIGVGCARVRPWLENGHRGAVLQSIGGTSGTPFADECPPGYFLQGVLGYSNGAPNGLQGLCVPILR